MSLAGPIIQAGAQLLGTGASMVQGGKLNKKNRQWQEDMWNKTNEYNSPVMQMQRFKEAGLNPHLIYGQGNSGNAAMASQPNQHRTDFNFGDAVSSYVAMRRQQTEIDNLEKARDVMDADIVQKSADTANKMSQSAKTDQERQQSSDLFATVKAQADQNLRNTELTGSSIQAQTQKALQDANLSRAQQDAVMQSINESNHRIKNIIKDGNLKDAETEKYHLENDLRRKGINPNDPVWMRILSRMFDDYIAPKGSNGSMLFDRRGAFKFQGLPKFPNFSQWLKN